MTKTAAESLRQFFSPKLKKEPPVLLEMSLFFQISQVMLYESRIVGEDW